MDTSVCVCSYRLAPESVFPAAFEDCVKATEYFLTNAAKFHVDPHRIGVAGELNDILLLLNAELVYASDICWKLVVCSGTNLSVAMPHYVDNIEV